MSTSGEQLLSNLQELIQLNQITVIRLYMLDSEKLYAESSRWSFGHEFIQIGDSSYNVNRLLKYQLDDAVLSLYF